MRLRLYHGWILVALLFALTVVLGSDAPSATGGPRGPRALLGPFGGLWSRVLWIRFQDAELRGDEARALDLAERALAYAPRDTQGWELLVNHLGAFLASPERTPDLERRRAFYRAALACARRGAETADEPARLHWLSGMLALSKAELDPALHVDGAAGLLAQAELAFRAAHEAGMADALELERYARERASE